MESVKKMKNTILRRLGRRNLIIVSLMLLIGLAVYLNYLWFYTPVDYLGSGDSTVGATPDNSDTAQDYFDAVALSRESARQESLEVLQSVVDTAGEGAEKEAALQQIAKIATAMEQEATVESLILSQGYDRCITVINGDTASVVVSSGAPLDAVQVAAITTVVYEQTGILPANLTVKQI